jgi:hypothetical protein
MNKYVLILSFGLALAMLAGHSVAGQQPVVASKSTVQPVEVIQFHLEHRCYSCNNIEKFTRSTLAANYPAIPFKLVNVEQKENEKLAAQFEASGSSLFLYNKVTGKKKDLTKAAFLAAGDQKKFEQDFRKSMDEFLKGK